MGVCSGHMDPMCSSTSDQVYVFGTLTQFYKLEPFTAPLYFQSIIVILCSTLSTALLPALSPQHCCLRSLHSTASLHSQMEQNYCIVTGANVGIGKEITSGLMEQGAHVVMACRNMEQCEQARQELSQRQLQGTSECCRLDLSDLQSIRSFAAEQGHKLDKQQQHLAVLVNNAGVMGNAPSSQAGPSSSTSTSTPGISSSSSAEPEDHHMRINHLGPFLLTGLLLPHMSAGSRVVNVSSRAHFACSSLTIKGSHISSGSNWWLRQYACSKACNILHARELQDRYQASRGIIATSVSPGFVNTSIFRSLPSHMGWFVQRVAPWLGRTPAEGAKTAVFAATSPTLSADKPVPLLLHDCKPLTPSALAQDKQLAQDLWKASCAAVGLEDDSNRAP